MCERAITVQNARTRLKRVVPRKAVPVRGVNDVPLRFGSQIPKTEMGPGV